MEYQKTNPRLVLVDSEIIAHAPSRYLVSGMGDAFTLLPECHGKFHGEKVAYGCLVELELYDPLNIKDKAYAFFKKVGLPVTLSDMCLPEPTDEQIALLSRDVAREDESQFSHHEPYSFDAATVKAAILAVDTRGRSM